MLCGASGAISPGHLMLSHLLKADLPKYDGLSLMLHNPLLVDVRGDASLGVVEVGSLMVVRMIGEGAVECHSTRSKYQTQECDEQGNQHR